MSSPNICLNLTGTNSTSAPAVGLTTYELWIQLILFYGFLSGIVASVCSVLIWVGIMRNKKLRNRFFIIVGCLTFCRTGICIQFMVMAIYRSLRTLEYVSTCQKRLICHAIHFWLINGWTIEMCLLFLLVIDRIIAIVKQNYYRQLTPKSAFQLCIAIYLSVSFIKLIPSYISADMLEVIACVNLYSAPGSEFNQFSQDIDFIMVGIILILYFLLLIYVQRKVKVMKRQASLGIRSDATANVALQRQLKLMPMLRNLVLMHCSLSLSAKLLLTLGVIVPNYGQRLTAYGGIMACIDVCANVIMLLLTNADIRAASLPCMVKMTNQVHTGSHVDLGSHVGKRNSPTVSINRLGNAMSHH